ncbi:MAG: exo-alpha-sialidase [Pirellulales bacterium]|nr:exo-alpha-sialidase [Pirellulales bacterium]
MSLIEKLSECTVYESPESARPRLNARFPGIVQLPSGRLLAMYVLVEKIDETIARTHLSYSDDLGATWHDQGEMYDPRLAGVESEFDECFKPLVLDDGSLLALGYRFNRPDLAVPIVNPATGGFLCGPDVVSRCVDGGRTWSVPVVMDCGVPETVELAGSAIQTRSGDILAVGGVFKHWDGTNPTGEVGLLVRSRDRGRTWSNSVYYRDDRDRTAPYEARICEMPDGRLVAIVWAFSHRENKNYPNRYVVSHDGGRSFSAPADTGHLGQAVGVMSLCDNLLLSIHCHRADARNGLFVRVVDFTGDRWNVLDEKLIWEPAAGQSNTGGLAYQVGALQFGQAETRRLNNGDVLAYFWGKENGLAKIKAQRLRIHT